MTVQELMDQLKDCPNPEETEVYLFMNDTHTVELPSGEKSDSKGWIYEIDKVQKYEDNPLYLEIQFTDYGPRKGLCRQCGNTSDFICFKCHLNPEKEEKPVKTPTSKKKKIDTSSWDNVKEDPFVGGGW